MTNALIFFVAGEAILPDYGLQAALACALQLRDFGLRVKGDVRERLDAIDQITRHRCGERRSANQNVHALCVRSEEHHRLARRVAAANDDDFARFAQLRLDRRRPVVDAFAFEVAEIRKFQASIARA